jgi:hypothetical protein
MHVVAYTFWADIYCPECITEQVNRLRHICSQEELDSLSFAGSETRLDYLAEILGIDRYDEASYDSDEFPKVVFSTSVDSLEHCCICHGEI